MDTSSSKVISFQELESLPDWTRHSILAASSHQEAVDSDGFNAWLINTTDSEPTDLLITKGVRACGWVPGVLLSRGENCSLADPYFARCSDAILSVNVTSAPLWLTTLCELSSKILSPLLHFATDFDSPTHARIVWEAEARLHFFTEGGAMAFFDDPLDAAAWEIAVNSVATDTELSKHLLDCMGAAIPASVLTELRPENFLQLKARRKRELSQAIIVRPMDWSFSNVNSHESSFDDSSLARQDKFFSLGGTPSLSFPYSEYLRASFPKPETIMIKAELLHTLWWWRSKEFKTMGPELKSLFFDNWERSALCYEYRARKRRNERGFPFGKPWPRLNWSERGVLAIIWPVRTIGRRRIQKEWPREVIGLISDDAYGWSDPSRPHYVNPKIVAKRLESFRAGLPMTDKRNKSPMRKLSEQWKAIESLDRNHFLGFTKLSHENSNQGKLNIDYLQGCENAGIEP